MKKNCKTSHPTRNFNLRPLDQKIIVLARHQLSHAALSQFYYIDKNFFGQPLKLVLANLVIFKCQIKLILKTFLPFEAKQKNLRLLFLTSWKSIDS
jgi:hypothetical protein